MREKILTFTKFIPFFIIIILTLGIVSNADLIKNYQVDEEPWDGYTLFAPEYSTMTYLIDIEGNVVHTWESEYIQGLACYLMEDGSIIRSCLPYGNPTFLGGGITGRIEIINWYGDLVWEFEYSNNQHCMHHDLEVLPNGNVLMIAWELKTKSQAISQGRNPNNIPFGVFWSDEILEIEPNYDEGQGGNIVWEWHAWDHLIQDYDSTKNNYGVVAYHSELIDINYFNGGPDWLHTNSVDYNEEFDQIMLSVHNFDEVWVIDHSTTTYQAKGHTGGNSGKGGDLLYRWGNPQAYRAGDMYDKKLFGQHDAQWIKPGLPGEGNILVFNNGQNRIGGQYSTVDEFIPPADVNGKYHKEADTAYGPEEQIWIYIDEVPNNFLAMGISGASRLPNGNTLICNGPKGYFFEVTPENNIIWDYQNPYPNSVINAVFKIQRYSEGHPGLDNLELKPNKPNTPDGPLSGVNGVEYYYTTSTIDPQEDKMFYFFSWGDGTNSGWIGPYESGETVEASHIWSKAGNYQIKVKAKDIKSHESIWSDPMAVSMPRNKIINNSFIQNLFQQNTLIVIFQNLFKTFLK